MVARILRLATLAVALLGSTLGASAQNGPPNLRTGSLFPTLTGPSLKGDPIHLPSEAEGHSIVILFSFSRAGGQRAQEWIQHLSREIPSIDIYSVIFLNPVPAPLRGMVVSSIKTKIQIRQQSRTALLYGKANAWKPLLETCDVQDVCVLLLGPDSHIRWMTGGAFSVNSDLALSSQLKSIGHE